MLNKIKNYFKNYSATIALALSSFSGCPSSVSYDLVMASNMELHPEYYTTVNHAKAA